LKESSSYCLNTWERAQCFSTQSDILCNVKKITLSYVSKIKSIFILSTAPRLESLRVWNCDELRHIITIDIGDRHDITSGNNWGTVFPKLRNLVVVNCVQLEYVVGLKHIITDTGDHDNTGGNNWGTVFPELR